MAYFDQKQFYQQDNDHDRNPYIVDKLILVVSYLYFDNLYKPVKNPIFTLNNNKTHKDK